MTMKWDFSKLRDGIEKTREQTRRKILMLVDTSAQKIQDEAKNNAKWTDRSGRARGSLTCVVEASGNSLRLKLAHGVDYGIWLELAHDQRYAIIDITLRYMGAYEVMPAFSGLLERGVA